MAIYGKHPPLKLADDPSDPVWQWFILNGPHGSQFVWESFSNKIPRDIEFLKDFIDEKTLDDQEFKTKARLVALRGFEMDNSVLIRKAIQVLTVIGKEGDLNLIKEFINHEDPNVVKDVKCCLFERGIKVKK